MGLLGYSLLLVLGVITVISYNFAVSSSNGEKVSVAQVWFYGWLTAISTGLGAIPFYFFSQPSKLYMGISNAIAGGMMIAASCSLVYEGSTFEETGVQFQFHPCYGVLFGFTFGIIFILLTKRILSLFECPGLESFDNTSANKIFLIIFVMTLHSLSEGIGIGVSFGGQKGMKLGQFISFSLAVHNIPEGLAVALVLTARKVTNLRAAIWAIFTSMPQPIMAIPAFIFVERFVPLLPIGLGFASGAMFFVAVFELLSEAIEDSSLLITGLTGTLSCFMMMLAQSALKGEN